jgi:hypothetical protein
VFRYDLGKGEYNMSSPMNPGLPPQPANKISPLVWILGGIAVLMFGGMLTCGGEERRIRSGPDEAESGAGDGEDGGGGKSEYGDRVDQ